MTEKIDIDELDDIDRLFLGVVALVMPQSSRALLYHTLKAFDINPVKNKAITYEIMDEFIQIYLERGLMIRCQWGGIVFYRVPSNWTEALLKHLQHHKDIKSAIEHPQYATLLSRYACNQTRDIYGENISAAFWAKLAFALNQSKYLKDFFDNNFYAFRHSDKGICEAQYRGRELAFFLYVQSKANIMRLSPYLYNVYCQAGYYGLVAYPLLGHPALVKTLEKRNHLKAHSPDQQVARALYTFWAGWSIESIPFINEESGFVRQLVLTLEAFMQCDIRACLKHYGQARQSAKHFYAITSKPKITCTEADIICVLAYIASSEFDNAQKMMGHLMRQSYYEASCELVNEILDNCLIPLLQGFEIEPDVLGAPIQEWMDRLMPPMSLNLGCILMISWSDPSYLHDFASSIASWAHNGGCLPRLQHLYQQVLIKHHDALKLDGKPVVDNVESCVLEAKYPHNICELVVIKPAWERALSFLECMADEEQTAQHKRLAWFVDLKWSREVDVREQKLSKKGKWSKGKPVAKSRLVNKDDLDYLTEHDYQALAALKPKEWLGRHFFEFDHGQLCYLLAGHPHVFDYNDPSQPVEIVTSEMTLQSYINEAGEYVVVLEPFYIRPGYHINERSERLFEITPVTQRQAWMAESIGQSGFVVPKQGQKQLSQVVQKLSQTIKVSAHDLDVSLPSVDADTTLYVHIMPFEQGVKLYLWVYPLGEANSPFHPGEGQSIVMGELQGRSIQTQRDLNQEINLARQWIEQSPTLIAYPNNDYTWSFASLKEALAVLSDIQAIEQPAFKIRWPKGQTMQVSKRLSTNDMSLKLNSQSSERWFKADGDVRVDDQQVMSMRELIDGLDNAQGQFVEIAPQQFIALTDQLKRQLDQIKRMSQTKGEKGLAVSPMLLPSLQNLQDNGVKIKTSGQLKKQWQQLQDSLAQQPALPSNLQAELRPYQQEGYVWLSRLATWGAGGCLADDMGLGKTLQAIALMISQAEQGPNLVISPSSVCHNWIAEIERFAPTLNPIQLHSSDREKVVLEATSSDVVIASYGLLVQEDTQQLLLEKDWHIALLDEGQAIKNPASKRAKAVNYLKSDQRIVLTGTPIENNLVELWSLFNFINPGFLPNFQQFKQRFITPIEQQHDQQARTSLRQLIQPFVLRRSKSAVLQELPEKMEQTLVIEPSDEELHFYESLRQRAWQHLQQLPDDEQAGQRQMHILAQLTKLRRSSCAPTLIDDSVAIASSKLKYCMRLIQDLIDNQHKVLVFSQFVDFLKMAREQLEKHSIGYQYLDGSTTITNRQKAVEAFQNGEGDVFLISLKAGGTGLNLTAANYVIHLDPWWNPAVEMQASDRAHRIGQQRAVTVYRLVLKHTVEEKILDLHGYKRDLAEQLLEGTDQSSKLDEQQLLALLDDE